jgi:hypothetical protein
MTCDRLLTSSVDRAWLPDSVRLRSTLVGTESQPSSAATTPWPTRRDVALRLQISVSSVRRLEAVRLHPVVDDRGVWRFDPCELDQLGGPVAVRRRASRVKRRARPGEVAARVFRMFSAGWNMREIVVRARQSPERVRQLYSEWLVGLKDGELHRRAREQHERERREAAEDERAQLEMMKAFGS